jgi:hypothetical protein
MTKRPVTIYGCSTDQKNECDYKYLARVWFYRTVAFVVVTGSGCLIYGAWDASAWKTANENRISEIDKRVANIEKTIQMDIDSVKTWTRPKE